MSEHRGDPNRAAGPERDHALYAAAVEALRGSGYRALGGLSCEVRGGVVSVSGVVTCFHHKQMAQAVLLRLHSVEGVRNLVEVRP